jgi:hypothetical protein
MSDRLLKKIRNAEFSVASSFYFGLIVHSKMALPSRPGRARNCPSSRVLFSQSTAQKSAHESSAVPLACAEVTRSGESSKDFIGACEIHQLLNGVGSYAILEAVVLRIGFHDRDEPSCCIWILNR